MHIRVFVIMTFWWAAVRIGTFLKISQIVYRLYDRPVGVKHGRTQVQFPMSGYFGSLWFITDRGMG